ncbi:hypothetical protein Ptr902_09569 [Pyrenophora tritici-repentis]|nr:hypothetical protein Ptr902_09569 [Pyrenophora tritici-repentis]
MSSTRDVVFDENSVFDGKTEDLMDNLIHNTLEEIATHVRTIELPTLAQQPETESFYEDSPPEESLAQDSEGDQPGYYQGRKIRDSYPTPPATPPPAALLARLIAGASLDEKDRQGTPKTAPWAAAFMAGTQARKVREYRGVAIDKAAIFLGVEIIRDRKARTIQLSQAAYADKISRLADRTDIRHDTLMATAELLLRDGLASPSEINKYQRKIGSLLFAAVTTRPDIAFATSQLARFLSNLRPEHHNAADQVL